MSDYTLDFELPLHEIEEKIDALKSTGIKTGMDVSDGIKQLEEQLVEKRKIIYENLSRWERVQLARHPKRPYSSDLISRMTDYWMELHGDRNFSDDPAMVCGIARLNDLKVMIISQEKGRGTKKKVHHNFGMARPEGYRKALRLMKLAEKYNIPVITLIDTPGAYPGLGAEERGQAEAIARNIFEMSKLRVPIITVVIGEGASGGALGIGVGDMIICFENTWYSVISPEGCASILFRDSTRASEAADSMMVTARDLNDLGIADIILPEPDGGNHLNYDEAARILKLALVESILSEIAVDPDIRIQNRINKFANISLKKYDFFLFIKKIIKKNRTNLIITTGTVELPFIKEISNKYPDKVTGVEQKGDKSILVLDTCKIVFGDKFNKNSSTKRINKQLRNNKANQ